MGGAGGRGKKKRDEIREENREKRGEWREKEMI